MIRIQQRSSTCFFVNYRQACAMLPGGCRGVVRVRRVEACASARDPASERDLIAPLQAQDAPRVGRARGLEAEPFEDLPRLADLLGVALGELAQPDPEAVLEPDPDV